MLTKKRWKCIAPLKKGLKLPRPVLQRDARVGMVCVNQDKTAMDPSDILGVLQRGANLKQNQLTLQEIAGLREDLRRKEAEEAAAPKCPYCAGAISNGVAKCRHCASEVQWCEVQGKAYVLKAEEVPQYFVQQKLHELAWEKQQRAEAEEAEQQKAFAAQQKAFAAQQRKNAPGAVSGAICGIISIALYLVPVVGLVLGIVALVLSFKGIAKAKSDPETYKDDYAIVGLVLGIFGLLCAVTLLFSG